MNKFSKKSLILLNIITTIINGAVIIIDCTINNKNTPKNIKNHYKNK